MSITQTKILNQKVQTPQVETNQLIINDRNLYNQLFTNSIFEKDFSTQEYLQNIQLGQNDTITFNKAHSCRCISIPIDQNYTSVQGDNYMSAGRYIKEISIVRINGDNAGLRNLDMHLRVNFYRQDGSLVDSFLSSNLTKQKSGEFKTTWTFDNVPLKSYYTKMVIGFYKEGQTTDNVGFLNTNDVRVGCWLKNNSGSGELLTNNLKISWNGYNNWQPHSPKVDVKIATEVPAMLEHYKDYSIHLDESDKEYIASFGSHMSNDDIHLTPEERTTLESLKQVSEGNVLQGLGAINEELTNHKNDNNVHFVSSQKSDILRSVRSFDQFKQEYLQNENIITDYSTTQLLGVSGNGVKARLHAWYLNVQNYKGQYFSQIIVPYPTDILANSDPAVQQPLQLFVDCLDENGNIIDTFFSTNNQGQSADSGEACWQFDEIYIRKIYHKLCFRMTKEWGVPQRPTTMKTHQIVCYGFASTPYWGAVDQDNKEIASTMNFRFKMRKEVFGLGELLNNLVQRIIDLQEKVRRLENS